MPIYIFYSDSVQSWMTEIHWRWFSKAFWSQITREERYGFPSDKYRRKYDGVDLPR